MDDPSPAMLCGTAFHAALEHAAEGDFDTLEALGHRFIMPDAEIALPPIREMRAERQYGPLTVSGQVDGLIGRTVIDHKTTSRAEPERYLDGCQWRFYLDLFEADTFEWLLWVVTEVEPRVYRVAPPQVLRAYRYPGLHDDCARLAADYYDFARVHLPQEAA